MKAIEILKDPRLIELNIAEGYRFLSRSFVERTAIKQAYAKGELNTHPLIAELAKWDNTGDSSDSGAVQRRYHENLTYYKNRIEATTDFTEEEKAALYDGLTYRQDLFNATFPYSRIVGNTELTELEKEFIDRGVDENRIEGIQRHINRVAKVLEDLPENYRANIVFTRAAPHPQRLREKLALKPEAQAVISQLENRISQSDMEYYHRWMKVIDFYGVKFHYGDRICDRVCQLERKVAAWRTEAPLFDKDGNVQETTTVYMFSMTPNNGTASIVLFLKRQNHLY